MTETKELVKQNTIVTVIEYMFSDKTKKEACELAGVAETTFDRAVASQPDLILEMQALVRSRMIKAVETGMNDRRQNAEAFSSYMEDLRETMLDPEADSQDRLKAFSALVKADKHLAHTIKIALPSDVKSIEQPLEPGVELTQRGEGKHSAEDVLARHFQGAKLRDVTITARFNEEEQDDNGEKDSDFVDGKVTDVNQDASLEDLDI